MRVSQEWDEVVHEVVLIIERLDAFRDDLKAAAGGGDLTGEECKFVRKITAVTETASQRCFKLYTEAMFRKGGG